MTRGEMRRLKDQNALLVRMVDEAHDRIEELQTALLDAPKSTKERGPVDAEMLYTVRLLSKYDSSQFAAVSR